jgi:hypothetical protein
MRHFVRYNGSDLIRGGGLLRGSWCTSRDDRGGARGRFLFLWKPYFLKSDFHAANSRFIASKRSG